MQGEPLSLDRRWRPVRSHLHLPAPDAVVPLQQAMRSMLKSIGIVQRAAYGPMSAVRGTIEPSWSVPLSL
ncbi:hypothetical protein [Leptolyngbya sp. 'hensonii']|uniref:hypothetical protein n=1 Tax=Leptolyngbya sp. 'hensonii' TaxID=1922337 RepID=UPI000AF3CA35|nr:hypothetical protein [Leptolyngbya sp. 'hensonii']